MDQLEHEFASLFRKHGAPLQTTAVPSPAGERLAQQLHFYRSIDGSVYVGALSALGFNALASQQGGRDFVAIYLGAITQLTLYAYQLFSDPVVYPHIGDSAREACDDGVIQRLRLLDPYGVRSFRYWPNDPTRLNAAERVAECACLILYLHELGHVRGCHLDLLNEESGVAEYQEIHSDSLNKRQSLLMRALELEADNVAIANGLSLWRELTARTGRHTVDGLDATLLWLTAAELLFWTMSFSHQLSRPDKLASHPSIATRYLNLLFYRGQQGHDDIELITAIKSNEYCVGGWAARHGLASYLTDYFHDDCDTAPVADEWKELRHEIEKHWDRLDHFQRLRAKRLDLS
jgi:hypothetical protein